ncbi:tryptophan 7-halogenase [soil metagenome]
MYDALIIGGGPAGLATAIMLAQLGKRTVLVAQSAEQTADKIGESLSPTANPILHQLGVWESFLAGQHRPCFGNQSSWGGLQLDAYDFINDPNGHGWHLDRRLFEEQLQARATNLGVEWLAPATLTQMLLVNSQSADAYWQLGVAQGNTEKLLTVKFVVDASGRASWFARRQGARRLYEDRQVALIAFPTASSATFTDSTSLVEAVPDGWWYSALLPDLRLATSFMTDPDLHERRLATTPKGWHRLLQQTKYTAQRVREHGYRLATKPHFVAADSGCLDQLCGDHWLAVGDAAMRYDPLSAHGLTLALAGGRDAALAISAALAGDGTALADYAMRLRLAYDQYAMMRQAFYRVEIRWPAAPYWQRRSGLT